MCKANSFQCYIFRQKRSLHCIQEPLGGLCTLRKRHCSWAWCSAWHGEAIDTDLLNEPKAKVSHHWHCYLTTHDTDIIVQWLPGKRWLWARTRRRKKRQTPGVLGDHWDSGLSLQGWSRKGKKPIWLKQAKRLGGRQGPHLAGLIGQAKRRRFNWNGKVGHCRVLSTVRTGVISFVWEHFGMASVEGRVRIQFFFAFPGPEEFLTQKSF